MKMIVTDLLSQKIADAIDTLSNSVPKLCSFFTKYMQKHLALRATMLHAYLINYT